MELTEEEAKKVRIFIDNYTFFSKLIDYGLNKPEHPQYVLYFNKFGVLRNIEVKVKLM